MTTQEINDCLDYITYGLYLVTCADGEKPNGLIVNTVFQVTADPARMAISVNKKSLTHDYIMKRKVFAAMPLDQRTPMTFIGTFGFRTGRNYDKFASVQYRPGSLGMPIVLDHTLSYMEVEVEEIVDVGTHTLFVGQVRDAGVLKENAEPLTYEYYHKVIKGKTPEGATHR